MKRVDAYHGAGVIPKPNGDNFSRNMTLPKSEEILPASDTRVMDPRSLDDFDPDCFPAMNDRQAPVKAGTVLEDLKLQYLFVFYHLNRLFKILAQARSGGGSALGEQPLLRQVDHWMQRREDLDRNAHRLGLYADPVRVHGKTLNVAFVEPQRRVDSRPRLRAFVIVPPENVSQNPKTPKTYG